MMQAIADPKKMSRAEPVFLVLFFFNTFLLPQGLSLSLLLTPVWLYLLHGSGRMCLLRYILVPFMVYGLVHLLQGADILYYTVSAGMMIALCIFLLVAWRGLNDVALNYERLFTIIAWVNFLFALVSIPLLLLPQLKPLVWYTMSMSEGIRALPRLKLFTYEASHYSYLLSPVFLFFCTQCFFRQQRRPWLLLGIVSIALLLSLSFGVLAVLLLSGWIILIIYAGRIFNTPAKRTAAILGFVLALAALYLLYRFYPSNILFHRFSNVLTGKDTSARGRTREAFILAHRIIAQKSYWWGIGPGQLKLLGRNIVVQFYSYSNIPSVIRIPNACAETMLCFGYLGLALRLGVQLWLFFRTRVFQSPYRLWLFLFLFIFQFTGSYITNAVEYIFWMLAFMPVMDSYFCSDTVKNK